MVIEKEIAMNALSHKFSTVLAVTAITASMALASPVAAAVRSFGKTYTVTATVKGGKNLTVLLVSGSGRLLASKKVTGTSQSISLKSPATASIGGATLQLVNSAGASKGAYFGPVTIGHKGKSSTSASRVYTQLKQSISTSVKLGTLTIKKLALANRATPLQVPPRQALTYLSAHKSVHRRDALPALAHSERHQELLLSHTASVQLPLVTHVLHLALQNVDLMEE